MKKSFVLYTDYAEKFRSLSDLQFGKLFRLIFEYEAEGTAEPTDDFAVNLAFDIVRADLDRNDQKYQEIAEKRRIAGKAGGLAASTKRKQMVANGSKCKQNVANQADNDNVNDNDNVILKENTKRNRKPTVAESRKGKIKYGDEVYLSEAEHKKLVEKYGEDATARMIEILDGYKVAKAVTYYSDYRAILNWVVSEYEKRKADTKKGKTKFSNFEERKYDFAALERAAFKEE